MTEGPLNGKWRGWKRRCVSYGHDDASVIDVSNWTACLRQCFPAPWLSGRHGWWRYGAARNISRAGKTIEMNRLSICFKHIDDIAERLSEYPGSV